MKFPQLSQDTKRIRTYDSFHQVRHSTIDLPHSSYRRIRGDNLALVKEQNKLYLRKYILFSQRTINEWSKSSTEWVNEIETRHSFTERPEQNTLNSYSFSHRIIKEWNK